VISANNEKVIRKSAFEGKCIDRGVEGECSVVDQIPEENVTSSRRHSKVREDANEIRGMAEQISNDCEITC
jgi:hypothetical protein